MNLRTACCGSLRLPTWLVTLSLIISAATVCAVIQITWNLFPDVRTLCEVKVRPQFSLARPTASEATPYQEPTYTRIPTASGFVVSARG